MFLDDEVLRAAQTLMCLRYGTLENAIVQGHAPCTMAFSKLPNSKLVGPVLPMEAVEVAGPSRLSHQINIRETVARRRRLSSEETEERTDVLANGGVPIGSGNTIVPADKFCKLRLKNFKFATRSLLDALFPKSVLATSSLTGRPSPAFSHLPAKQRLDPVIVKDIVEEILRRFPNVTADRISKIITTKCADEAKIVKKKKKSVPPKKRERRKSSEESGEI